MCAIDEIDGLLQGVATQVEFVGFQLVRCFGMDTQFFDQAADRALNLGGAEHYALIFPAKDTVEH